MWTKQKLSIVNDKEINSIAWNWVYVYSGLSTRVCLYRAIFGWHEQRQRSNVERQWNTSTGVEMISREREREREGEWREKARDGERKKTGGLARSYSPKSNLNTLLFRSIDQIAVYFIPKQDNTFKWLITLRSVCSSMCVWVMFMTNRR